MATQVTLKIHQISRPADLQMRESLRTDHVRDMAEALNAGATLPPVKVVREGNAYWLWDGHHRVSAHETAGVETIKAEITKDGDRNDARWLACAANKEHDALKRSVEDKRAAVEKALEAWPHMSDRAIAEHVGVSNAMVSKYRPEDTDSTVNVNSSTGENTPVKSTPMVRTGRDGKKRSTKKKASKKKSTKKKDSSGAGGRGSAPKPAKPGTEVLGPKDRKTAYTALGKVIRILDGTPLWETAKPHLYAVNDLLESPSK